MRGRVPAPRAIVDAKGDPSNRRRNTSEPKSPSGEPAMPGYLNDDAIAVEAWQALMKRLGDMHLLSTADATSYEMYAIAYSRWRTAYDNVKKAGAMLQSETTNQFYTNPAIHDLNNCQNQLRQLNIEFGMTPAARARMRVADTGQGKVNSYTVKYGA